MIARAEPETRTAGLSSPRLVLAAGALAAVYFTAGKLGLSLAVVHKSASAVWPPTGIALAALLVLGHQLWPGVFLGAFLVNVTTAGSIPTCLGIALGNTLETLVGVHLVRRFAGGRRAFDRSLDVFRFAVLAGLVATMVSATFGVTSLCLGGTAPWSAYGSVWATWWLGDAAGALVVTPLLVLWSKGPWWPGKRVEALEAAVFVLSVLLVGLLIFGGAFPARITNAPLGFLSVPLPLWAAFRFGQRGAATAAGLLSAVAIWGTMRGLGPFASDSPNESLLLLQGFTAVVSVTSTAVAAVVVERGRVEESLRRLNEELEERVALRSAQLQAANEELGRRAAALARSNAELERFAYVASHDLQEPLRMVSSFTQLLARRYRGKLDPQADEFIHYAVDGAERMQALINDILNLSRVESRGRDLEPTDCEEVLRHVLLDLGPAAEDTGGVVTHGPLPHVLADALQLGQLFQNLIANALKYRSEAPPLVHVAAERAGRDWTFSVSDNGLGIPPDQRERVFEVFQRLHGPADYVGTGMGLAICRKIVERHGGRIWVDPQEKGSTFRFTIPALAGDGG